MTIRTKDELIKKVIRMDANENPLGCSKKVIEHIGNIKPNFYPEFYSPKLRGAIAEKHNVKPEQVFCGGSGSDNLIKVITQSLVQPGEEVIIPEISFPTYIIASNMVKAKKVLVPLKDHAIDLQGTINAITDKTKLIWLSNPHNPTGTIFKKQEFEAILDKIPSNVIFVMDEAYIELSEDSECANSLDYKEKYPNMIILRTFSKAYGLASMRIGYGIANEELVNLFYKSIGVYDVNLYAEECALIALEDDKFIQDVRKVYKREKEYLYKEFANLKLPIIKSHASFIMVYIGDEYVRVAEALRERGILVKSGNYIGMNKWIRVSVLNTEDNKFFIQNFKEILKG